MKARKAVIIIGVFCLVLAVGLLDIALAQSKPVKMKFSYGGPPKGPFYNQVYVTFVDNVKKQSQGKLDITIFPSGTLLKSKDAYKGIVNGVADMTWTSQVRSPGLFPLTDVVSLPFMIPSMEIGTAVLNDLYKEFPEIQAEYSKVHVLWLWGTLMVELHTTKKPVRTLEDIKGMKIACHAGPARTLKALGASPVVMPITDIYQSLEKGVVDGAAVPYGWFGNFRYYEVTKFHTNAHMGGGATMTILNKKRWESLSPDMQKVISDAGALGLKASVSGGRDQRDLGIRKATERNQEMITLTPAERKRWVKTALPAWDQWVKKMEGKGLPGRKILDRALELVQKYQATQ